LISPGSRHSLLACSHVGEGKDLFRICLLLLGLTVSIVGQPMAACHSITLTGELQSGDRFEKVIGGELVFRLEPERLGRDGELHGWRIGLAPLHEPDRDYIYPVNPPLRFNGLQILGPSYGDDTKRRWPILRRCVSCLIERTTIESGRY
jgi:hypothetical protein